MLILLKLQLCLDRVSVMKIKICGDQANVLQLMIAREIDGVIHLVLVKENLNVTTHLAHLTNILLQWDLEGAGVIRNVEGIDSVIGNKNAMGCLIVFTTPTWKRGLILQLVSLKNLFQKICHWLNRRQCVQLVSTLMFFQPQCLLTIPTVLPNAILERVFQNIRPLQVFKSVKQ